MTDHRWVQEFPGAITVCDREGIILEMNDRSAAMFVEDGGLALVGTNVLDCHPEPSRTKLIGLLATQQANVYTIQQGGKTKLIYQTPWYQAGLFAGLVEMALEIPAEMAHFDRDR